MTATANAFISKARALLNTDYLPKIERCLESLSDENVWWRANADSNSIGNLMLHLSGNARQWIVSGVGGMSDARERQAEFDASHGMSRVELLATLTQVLAEVDAVLSQVTADTLLETKNIQACDVTVLDAIFHVVEHFSMHTGQIILITKMLSQEKIGFYDFSTGAPTPNWSK